MSALTDAAFLAVAVGLAAYLTFATFVQLCSGVYGYKRWRSYGHGRWASLGVAAQAATGNSWVYCCTCPLGRRAWKDADRERRKA